MVEKNNDITYYRATINNRSNLICRFPRRCAPLIAPSSRFATPSPSFPKEGTTGCIFSTIIPFWHSLDLGKALSSRYKSNAFVSVEQ